MTTQCIRSFSLAVAAVGIGIAAAHVSFAQHAPAHAGGSASHAAPGSGAARGHAPPSAGPNQHLDGRFGHDHYYNNPGYAVRRPPGGPRNEFHDGDGRRFRFDRGNWYRWNDRSWISWSAPFGLYIPFLPPFYTTVWSYGVPYYYANDTYYQWDGTTQEYEVVSPPDGIEANGMTQPPASDQLFVYPSNGQSDAQQAQDRDACRQGASAQTGYNPNGSGGGAPADQALQKRNNYFRAQVSCLEGRGYTVR